MHSCGTCTNLVTSFWWFRQQGFFLCKSKLGVRFFGRWERVNVGFDWTVQKGPGLDAEVSHWRQDWISVLEQSPLEKSELAVLCEQCMSANMESEAFEA